MIQFVYFEWLVINFTFILMHRKDRFACWNTRWHELCICELSGEEPNEQQRRTILNERVHIKHP